MHPPHAVVRRQVDPGLLRRGGHAAGEGAGEGESVSQSGIAFQQFDNLIHFNSHHNSYSDG